MLFQDAGDAERPLPSSSSSPAPTVLTHFIELLWLSF